ncbi:macro domain-containing protein [Isoptericola sp. NPDC056573]|uniref:macro domain-containing protein n=1 Tax=Isoptericola sp. NPDC056573 TaxID=3345868 RepID=UPI0036A22B5B
MTGRAVISEASGDLLAADVDALVNAVNTVGVMGKGLALQFRRVYPAMFDDYREACRSGEVRVGRMHVWETGADSGPRFVVSFPTKEHWRSASRLAFVDDGLVDLAAVIRRHGIRSVAVPALGAGLGGLDWGVVRPRIVAVLGELDGVDVRLYGPQG